MSNSVYTYMLLNDAFTQDHLSQDEFLYLTMVLIYARTALSFCHWKPAMLEKYNYIIDIFDRIDIPTAMKKYIESFGKTELTYSELRAIHHPLTFPEQGILSLQTVLDRINIKRSSNGLQILQHKEGICIDVIHNYIEALKDSRTATIEWSTVSGQDIWQRVLDDSLYGKELGERVTSQADTTNSPPYIELDGLRNVHSNVPLCIRRVRLECQHDFHNMHVLSTLY